MPKKNDKSLHKKYTIKNIKLDEVYKILDDYVTIQNKKFDFYFINCEFVIEFDKNFTTNIEINYFHTKDTKIIEKNLLYYIYCFRSRGCQVYNVNQRTIKTISDRYNMIFGDYHKQPMLAVEGRIIMNIDKNLQLMNSFNN